jgi:hypothetical protein
MKSEIRNRGNKAANPAVHRRGGGVMVGGSQLTIAREGYLCIILPVGKAVAAVASAPSSADGEWGQCVTAGGKHVALDTAREWGA